MMASRRRKLNALKTKLIWFGSRTALRKMTADQSVIVGSVDEQPTDTVSVCNVGVLLYSELPMKQHINKVTSACLKLLPPAPADTAETSRVSRRHETACLSLHN